MTCAPQVVQYVLLYSFSPLLVDNFWGIIAEPMTMLTLVGQSTAASACVVDLAELGGAAPLVVVAGLS